MHIEIDLGNVREAVAGMAAENEAALAACAGHDFAPLNNFARPSYACRHCTGVIGYDAHLQHQQGRA